MNAVRRYWPEGALLVTVAMVQWAFGWFWGIYWFGTVLLFSLAHHLVRDRPDVPLKLQSQQPFALNTLQGTPLAPEALYQAAVQLTVHSDANSWTRLYTLLTANSIMMLAWATVFVAQLPAITKGQVGFFVALPAFLLSAAWAPFGSRNRRLHRRWGDFYARLEETARPQDTMAGPGVAAEALSYLWVEEHCKSGHLVVAVPLAFADVFLFVMLTSLFQWTGW